MFILGTGFGAPTFASISMLMGLELYINVTRGANGAMSYRLWK